MSVTSEQARELSERVKALTDASVEQAQRTKRNTAIIYVTVASLVLDIVITVVLTVFGVGINSTQTQIADNQARIETLSAVLKADSDRNRSGQCALMSLFIQSEGPTKRNPTMSDEQRKLTDDSFVTIHKIYDDLKCA